MSCQTCENQDSIVTTNEKKVQRSLLYQAHVHSSLYTMNISTLNNKINNTNEGIKYNSYDRYLNKKKGKVFSKQGTKVESPIQGNKTKSISLSSKTNCSCSP